MVIGLEVGIEETDKYPHAFFSRDIERPTSTFSGLKTRTLQLFHIVVFMKDCILSTPKASLLRAVFPSSNCNQASKSHDITRPAHYSITTSLTQSSIEMTGNMPLVIETANHICLSTVHHSPACAFYWFLVAESALARRSAAVDPPSEKKREKTG